VEVLILAPPAVLLRVKVADVLLMIAALLPEVIPQAAVARALPVVAALQWEALPDQVVAVAVVDHHQAEEEDRSVKVGSNI